MLPTQKIEQILQQVQDSLPEGVKAFGQEAESKFKQALQAQLSKLDLVTREEFDIQTQVLLRTRGKIEKLEARLDALLEQQENNNPENKA